MRRYIVLLLITGIVWAQTDFDTLVLKNGTVYFGEFSTIDGDNVFFKPKGASDFQSISIKQIKILQLKDGQFIIGSSSDILTDEAAVIAAEEAKRKLSTENVVIIGCIIVVVMIYNIIQTTINSVLDGLGGPTLVG